MQINLLQGALHGEPNMGEECECSVDALEIVPDEGEAVPA